LSSLFGIILLISGVFHPLVSFALSIGGVVRQPMNLSDNDMVNLAQYEVKVTEVSKNGSHTGVFAYRGVSLKNVLSMADIRKEVAGYSRSVDLTVLIHNRNGNVAALSWGEIFYRNAGDIIIATSATPLVPHANKGCGECHGQKVYQPALDQLNRKILFPKLVISSDFYSDRCLEDITHIEVVEPRRALPAGREKKASSQGFSVSGSTGKTTVIANLDGHGRVSVLTKEVGSGRGYHGVKKYDGVSLRSVLEKLEGSSQDMDKVLILYGADGYQSLVSAGELFLSSIGDRIIVADRMNGALVGNGKSFHVVIADDNSSERLVKDIVRIEAISLKPKAKLYIIGFGCGDTNLITLEAITHMGKAQAFVAAADFADRFSKYMGDKPVLFDPFTSWEPVYKKSHPELSDEEVKKQSEALRKKEIGSIWDMLRSGRSVAVLEPGDPTIYGGWQNWLMPEFEGQTEIITGMSSFSAANAMIGANIASNTNSMVLTTPWALKAHEETIRAVAQAKDTMAIFMGLKDLESMVPILSKYYAPDTPVTIVYKAGISHEKRLVKTKLSQVVARAASEKEPFLGLIYIGL
jgi:precorrin-4 methylase